jgi:hypothetical protein
LKPVVALDSGASPRALEGPNQTLRDQDRRARVIGAIDRVDLAVVFDADNPLLMFEALRPDILIDGAERQPPGIEPAAPNSSGSVAIHANRCQAMRSFSGRPIPHARALPPIAPPPIGIDAGKSQPPARSFARYTGDEHSGGPRPTMMSTTSTP